MKKKRVETFRNIYGMVTVVYITIIYYTDSAAAVSPPVGLAQARPNNTDSAAAVSPPGGARSGSPQLYVVCAQVKSGQGSR